MDIHSNILVMDNGMWSIKTGFAGDEAPRHLERSLVGICKNKTISRKIHHKEFYSGKDILEKREILNIKSPVQMVNFSHIEDFIHNYMDSSKIQTSEEKIKDQSYTEPDAASKENKPKNSLLDQKHPKLVSKSTGELSEGEIPGTLGE